MMLNKNPSNKRKTLTTTLSLTLLVAALAGSLFVNLASANPVGFYIPRSPPPAPIVEVIELNTDKLTLTFSVQETGPWITPYGMGADYDPSHVYEYTVSVLIWVDGKPWSPCDYDTKPITASLEGLSDGWHTLEVIATASGDGLDWPSSQGSSEILEVQVDYPPPSVQIQSMKNATITKSEAQFTVRVVGHPLIWVGYSVDGEENVTVNQEALVQSSLTSYDKVWKGKLTLEGLSKGAHSLVVYAKDQCGNSGASASEEFTVAESATAQEKQAAPLPTTLTATAIVASAALISFSLVAYFVKRRRKNTT